MSMYLCFLTGTRPWHGRCLSQQQRATQRWRYTIPAVLPPSLPPEYVCYLDVQQGQ